MVKKIGWILLSLLCLNSCFFKSVMKGEADDIIKARIYDYDGKTCLVMLEAVFQATSKEGGRGLTQITGYNEYRISVYDMSDGRLIARKKAGKDQKKPIEFLGCTPHHIWFYSFENGLHSLDPFTLEKKVSQDTIFELNPELRGNLAVCDWYQIPQFFQFNDITRTIILTDNKGFRYFMDTGTLRAEKSLQEYTPFKALDDRPFETSVTLVEPRINISGDLRKQIRVNGKEVNPALTFLDGQFIMERNPEVLMQGIKSKISFYSDSKEKLNAKIQLLRAMNNGAGPVWRSPERDTLRCMENSLYSIERTISDLEKGKADIPVDGYSHYYNQLLSSDSTTFFVFHRAGTQKDAGCLFSLLQLKDRRELKEIWTTEIPGLFFDPSAARETSTFREVFSKGNPEFRFSFFGLVHNKLIVVWMLHAVCLDYFSGKVLWIKRI